MIQWTSRASFKLHEYSEYSLSVKISYLNETNIDMAIYQYVSIPWNQLTTTLLQVQVQGCEAYYPRLVLFLPIPIQVMEIEKIISMHVASRGSNPQPRDIFLTPKMNDSTLTLSNTMARFHGFFQFLTLTNNKSE